MSHVHSSNIDTPVAIQQGVPEMKTTRLLSIGFVVAMTLAASQQASAQIVNFLTSPGWSNLIHTLQTNSIVNNASGRGNKRNSASSGSSSTATPTSTGPIIEVVPAYRRYPAVQFKSTGTRLTLQEYLDSVNVSPQDKAELKQLILAMLEIYETEAARKGYPNDLALALVSSLELNSHVYHGKTEKPLPFGQNVGVRDMVAEHATDNGTFNSLSDRQKQELYELFIMLGGLAYHFYEKALKEIMRRS
jgi:hypothetical protein